jgi:large subunit ribosomal protein L10
VASLPTRHEALCMLAGTLMAPVNKFVRTLAEPHTRVVRALDGYRKQKEQA